MYGLFDTQDEVWMGNDDGPLTYEDSAIARIAAQTIDAMLRQRPGRTRATDYEPGPKRLRDDVAAEMDGAEALRKLEQGLV